MSVVAKAPVRRLSSLGKRPNLPKPRKPRAKRRATIATTTAEPHAVATGNDDLENDTPALSKKFTRELPPEADLASMTLKEIIEFSTFNAPPEEKAAAPPLEPLPGRPEEPEPPREDDQPKQPKVSLVNGKLVVNENMFVQKAPTIERRFNGEIVDKDRIINSLSFKTNLVPNKRWTPEETRSFYTGLRMFGPNFMLITLVVPSRNRAQIRNKFKKEESTNPHLIEFALNHRTPPSLEEAQELLKKASEPVVEVVPEVNEKKTKKVAQPKKVPKPKQTASKQKPATKTTTTENENEDEEEEDPVPAVSTTRTSVRIVKSRAARNKTTRTSASTTSKAKAKKKKQPKKKTSISDIIDRSDDDEEEEYNDDTDTDNEETVAVTTSERSSHDKASPISTVENEDALEDDGVTIRQEEDTDEDTEEDVPPNEPVEDDTEEELDTDDEA